ncbi:hypothetical protein EON64_08885 [archaeon]|nr:MAG: hypothetical protein EON64_08885 [archaeon]
MVVGTDTGFPEFLAALQKISLKEETGQFYEVIVQDDRGLAKGAIGGSVAVGAGGVRLEYALDLRPQSKQHEPLPF